MPYSPVLIDDCVDDFDYALSDEGSLIALGDDPTDVFAQYVPFDDGCEVGSLGDDTYRLLGYSSFFEAAEAHAVYAEVAELAHDAARKRDARSVDHAGVAADRQRSAAAQAALRAADPDGVRKATRERVRAYRARKRAAERLARQG